MFKQIHILTLAALFTGTLLVNPAARAQTHWYVDDDAPNDPGPGDPTLVDVGVHQFQDTLPPPTCMGDLDGDFDLADLALLLSVYGTTCD